MLKNIMILTLLFFVLSTTGCQQYNSHYTQETGITINEHFNSEIKTFESEIVNQQINCLSGDCPTISFDPNKTYTKECYFCNTSQIIGNELRLSTGYSGGSDFSFGCHSKFSGPSIDGMQIIKKTDDILIVQGTVKYTYSKKSNICDKTIDPNCSTQTYGRCSEPDYEYELYQTEKYTFKSD
jgi:hypothetical protein